MLLPARQATLAATLAPPFTVVDRWVIGDVDGRTLGAAVVTDARGRRIVVPGMLVDGAEPMRDTLPVSRLVLGASASGDFTVESFSAVHPGAGEREISTDQANESILVGGDDDAGQGVVVKWQLLLDDEPGPGADRLAMLADAGFADMPEPVRIARWRDHPIATATQFIPGATDGWTWAVGDLRAWAQGTGPEPIEAYAELGGICARMHRALAGHGMFEIDGAVLRDRAIASLDEAAAATQGADADLLAALRPRLLAQFDAMLGPRLAIAVHGDLHVGQVLRGDDGRLRITDFDGNPVLSAAERRQPQPPARDVAGMLASIDHVARVVMHRTEGIDPAVPIAWIPRAQAAFLDAYRAQADDLLDPALLRPMQVEQECREFAYAARQLPHWRYVPAAALPALMED